MGTTENNNTNDNTKLAASCWVLNVFFNFKQLQMTLKATNVTTFFFHQAVLHPHNLSPLFLHPPVLPVLLVSSSRDADGWEAVMHEAKSHRTSLWTEQLPPDQ